jgi:hypothetical protein
VAVVIVCSASGFLLLVDASALFEEAHVKSIDGESTMKGRPQRLQNVLLRYLPMLSVALEERSEKVLLCVRPPQAHDHILQFATLAMLVRVNSRESEQRAKEVPVLKYLHFLSTEQDCRVFKELLTHSTRTDFVVKQYKWKRGSIAAITEELAVIDFYMADLDKFLESVSYQAESKAYQRQKQRAAALAELRVSHFMLWKGEKGGRPSKLFEHACCLGQHIERAVENLGDGYGAKADRRRQDGSLHRGGRLTVTRIWVYVLQCRCCRTGELINVSRKTVHRAMHPANCRLVAGRLHMRLADVKMHKVTYCFCFL